MYASITMYRLTTDDGCNSDQNLLINSFVAALPRDPNKQFYKHIFQASFELLKSDNPLLTVSRQAAAKYFNRDLEIEEVMYFSSWAKTYNDLLDTFLKEHKIK